MNEDFEAYVERYCRQYDVTPEEAMEHKLVQEVKLYYEITESGGVY